MWPEQAAPPPSPSRLTHEQEMLEESNISNTPMAVLRPLVGATIAMALGPGRATALQPSLPWAKFLCVRSPQGGSTELMHPTKLMALERLRLTTLPPR